MATPRLLFLALTTLLCTCVRAQVSDNFEDGDLLNPTWFGDTDDFVVTDGRLRLMADGAGESRLSIDLPGVANPVAQSIEFLVEMDFAPSGSNRTRLLLENCEGGSCTNVGEVAVGGISGADDRVEVYLINDAEIFLELSGAVGAVGGDPALVRFRLAETDGAWSLSTNYTGGADLTVEDTGVLPDLAFNRFTIVCEYTATRADKFSFDDFNYQLDAPVDTVPPNLLSAEVLNATTVELRYNEVLDAVSVEPTENYSIVDGPPTINAVLVDGTNVLLTLADELPANQSRRLRVSEMRDVAGNAVNGQTVDITYFVLSPPTAANVILNEFMADPNPVVGLPNAEFLELYNPTEEVVDASRIAIASGGTPVALPAGTIIPPNGYLVVAGDEIPGFEAVADNVVEVSFPSLTNGGDVITVLGDGVVLTEINYTEDWYNDPERDGGGYSLEYVGGGADAGCGGSWKASEDAAGGTPGRLNSVDGRTVDTSPPFVTGVGVNPSSVDVFFSEALDAAQISDPGLFAIDNGATVSGVTVLDPFTVSLDLVLQPGIIYTLTVLPDFSDCSGNFPPQALTFQLAIPDEPQPGDVVINEILFNPASGGSDFLELYNCSDKVFQIEGWELINTQSTSQTSAQRTIDAVRLFLPGEHLVLTADPDDLMMRYFDVDSSLLVDQTLPSLPDDEGNITVQAGGLVLDAFDYSEDFHSALLSDEDGASLERIRYKGESQDGNNWFTAAQAENFATPTRENSQFLDATSTPGDQFFTLLETTFSPDGDGFQDFLELNYEGFGSPGFLTRIRIFDAQGRPVRTLREVELLGAGGVIRWDGSNDEGRRARAGIYVLFVELFNPNGEVREEKLTAVLAGSL